MDAMRVGDLNLTADNASTITGSMNTLFIRHAGGEKTRAVRLPDQEPHNGGELLQTVQLETRVNARYPADNEDHGGGKASRLKPSTPSGPHPETSGRLKNRGVMDMVWESDDESEVEDSVSEEEDSLERLENKIKEEGVGLVVQLESLLDHRRTRGGLICRGNLTLLNQRETLLEDMAINGMSNMLLLSTEDQEAMRFCPADVAINMVDKWNGDWNQFLESKKSEFDMEGVRQLLERASVLLTDLFQDLEMIWGPELLGRTIGRHDQLRNGLMQGKKISREAARLFPRETAGEILAWYSRLVSVLELEWQWKLKTQRSMATLGKFAAEYPGPEVLARNDRNDQWRQELSQQVRGSMIGGQSHRSAAEVNQSKEWQQSRSVEGREGIPSSIQGMANWPGSRVVAGQQSQPHLSLSGRSQEVAERRADLDGYNYRVGRVPELGEYMNVPRVKKRVEPFLVDTTHPSAGFGHRREDSGVVSIGSHHSASINDGETDSRTGSFYTVLDRGEVERLVTEGLSAAGFMSTLTFKMIMDYLPRGQIRTKDSKKDAAIRYFSRVAKNIIPETCQIEGMINMPQWFLMWKDEGDE